MGRDLGGRAVGMIAHILLFAPVCFGIDIFDHQGPRAKLYGGAGITESRSGAAILYNAANICEDEGNDVFFDFSPSKISFQYTPPPDAELAPGKIDVPFAPLVSFGSAMRRSKVGIGFVFVPTGLGTKTETKNFPVPQGGGTYQVGDILNERTSFKAGIGLAYRFSESFSLGLSFIYDYLKSSSTVSNSGLTLKISNKNTVIIPKVGLRYKASFADFGVEYQPRVTGWYSLSAALDDQEPTDTFRKSFRPRVIGIGVITRKVGSFDFFSQYRNENWVSGTYEEQSPTQILEDAPVEFLNTHNFVLGSSYHMSEVSKIIGSYTIFGPNKGAGVSDENGQTLFHGRSVQDFESLKRFHITIGMEFESPSSRSMPYFSYIKGTAISGEETPTAGFYELTILMLGYGRFFK